MGGEGGSEEVPGAAAEEQNMLCGTILIALRTTVRITDSGDTDHRWMGLTWATGKGGESEAGPGALQFTPCSTLREAK